MLFNSLNKIKDIDPDAQINERPEATLDSPEMVTDKDVFKNYNCNDISKQYVENNFQINFVSDYFFCFNSNV